MSTVQSLGAWYTGAALPTYRNAAGGPVSKAGQGAGAVPAPPMSPISPAPPPPSSLQGVASRYDLKAMSGSDVWALADDLAQIGVLDGDQQRQLSLLAGIDQTTLGPVQTPRDLVQQAQTQLDSARTAAPQTVPALQGVLGVLQSMARVQGGHPPSHWVA